MHRLAGRAALLQLAHPWVAVALEQHSSLLANPIARFHNTFRVVFAMVFGSQPQAFAAARALHTLHAQIRGNLPSAVAGYAQQSPYEANFIPALRWVFATLVESAVLAYDCVLPPLTACEHNAYYSDSKRLAALFGIPPQALPADWMAFTLYMDEMAASDQLGVDSRSRAMAHRLLSGAGSWLRPPQWYRALTAEWLPPRFRQEFSLPWDANEERAAASARRRLPLLYRGLPKALRFVGPYLEAQRRLSLRPPGLLAHLSNRFWIGQPQLPFGH